MVVVVKKRPVVVVMLVKKRPVVVVMFDEEAAGGGGDVGEEAAGDGDGGDLPPAPVGSGPVVRYSVNWLSAMAHNDVVAAWSNDILGAAGAAVGKTEQNRRRLFAPGAGHGWREICAYR